MGIFSWLRGEMGNDTVATANKTTSVAERIAELNRTATCYKDEKEWDRAIACLREAAALTPESELSYPAEHYTRLPLFLQQGGYFDEAMREFELLIASTPSIIAKDYAHQNKTARSMIEHSFYYTIYDKMRVACKRQKLPDEAAKYETLHVEHKGKHAQLFKKSPHLQGA